MAYNPSDVKYSPNTHTHQPVRANMTGYAYSSHPPQHFQQTDENRNENLCSPKESLCLPISQQSSSTQTVQKVDAATMTDPLQIDFRLTSEYLARCSGTLGLPYITKYEDNSNSPQNCPGIRPKIEFEIEPQHINGTLGYRCFLCPKIFEDRETFHVHLEYDKHRLYICDICRVSQKCKGYRLSRCKQAHNKDRIYKCCMCCKMLKCNEYLVRYMISRNEICVECGKAFSKKDHLKKHLQNHFAIRNDYFKHRRPRL